MTLPVVGESGTKEPMVSVMAGKAVTFPTASLSMLSAVLGIAKEAATFEDWPT